MSAHSPMSMAERTHGMISAAIEQSIAGVTTDVSVLSKVIAEDRPQLSNVIKIIAMVCNPPSNGATSTLPCDIVTMKSTETEREYSVGVSVSGAVLPVHTLLDLLRICNANILAVYLNVDADRPKNQVTISVHISTGPRTITDAIYVLNTRPKGQYTTALTHALSYSEDVGTPDSTPSSPASAAASPNGRPPPAKKRKRSGSDVIMDEH